MERNLQQKRINLYIKPKIFVTHMETEGAILNSSTPTGTVPDMPWEESYNETNLWE